jgi:hypothetical protein
MRRANLARHLYGLLIFICVICLFPVFPLPADGASLADLAGKWNYNSFISGPSAPWWERGTLNVKPDGTFTGSGKDSKGNPDSLSGAFAISSDGIVMTGCGYADTPLCRIDSGNTVLVCTHISDAGSSNLTIFTKKAPSYSPADLAGNWEANFLSSGPTPWWATMTDTALPDGTYKGIFTPSDGPSTGISGQMSISRAGTITCVAGDCLSSPNNYAAFMGASKTVSVGTSGASLGQDALLSVSARQAASYSTADLAGMWRGNSLASGPGSPYWERDSLVIDADGTFSVSWTASDGTSGTGAGALSISPEGEITCVSGDCADRTTMSFMDAGKTVAAGAHTWLDGATREIAIFTKEAALTEKTGAREERSAPATSKKAAASSTGSLSVTINPTAAVTAGAQWSVDGGSLQISGTTVSALSAGSHKLAFNSVAGWNSPAGQTVKITVGKTTSATGLYVQQTGSLKVTLSPAAAVKAGAMWSVNGGAWQKSGATVSKLPIGLYTVTFQTVAGWNSPSSQSATVANNQTASVTGLYEEQVGSVQVTISPAAAVTAGAQWKVDTGAWQVSGAVVEGLAVGSHKLSFKSVTGWNSPKGQNVSVSESQTAPVDVSYVQQTGALKVTITPQAAVLAGANWNVDNGAQQQSGATVSGIPVGKHVVNFAPIVGYSAPGSFPVTISNGKTTSTSGSYKLKPGGSLTVTITPAGAVAAGAQWNVDGGAWQNSGDTVDNLSKGSHTVTFSDVAGWNTPDAQAVNISSGKTTDATGVYVQQTGSLTVTISPAEAVSAGAQWNVDGGAWQNSGATVGKLTVGNHTVNFKTITNWTTPASQTVKISSGQTASATGVYASNQLSWTPISAPCSYVSGGCSSCPPYPPWYGAPNCASCSVAMGYCELYQIDAKGTACGAPGAQFGSSQGAGAGNSLVPPPIVSCGQWHQGTGNPIGQLLYPSECVRGAGDPECTTIEMKIYAMDYGPSKCCGTTSENIAVEVVNPNNGGDMVETWPSDIVCSSPSGSCP